MLGFDAPADLGGECLAILGHVVVDGLDVFPEIPCQLPGDERGDLSLRPCGASTAAA